MPRLMSGAYNSLEPMQIDVPLEENENAEEAPFEVTNPNLDLDLLMQPYRGYLRLQRLIFIADHCPPLRVEALRLALSDVQKTSNVPLYEEIYSKLSECVVQNHHGGGGGGAAAHPDGILNQGVLPAMDQTWIDSTSKGAARKAEKLDQDLKNYKTNSIKESIRRGYDDLGDHYLDCGDLNNALKNYSRARDYCTNGKNIIQMCVNVIRVSIYLRNWSHVLSYVNKAEATPEFQELSKKETFFETVSFLKCAAGLAEMATKKFKSAAKCFLIASFDHCNFSDIISSTNIATYGALCALASFDRHELYKSVLSSSSFKQFLELEPPVRETLFAFYDSKYAMCLRHLDTMRDALLLDLFLSPHVNALYEQIRQRALTQYFSPYLSASLPAMAAAFNSSVNALEDELMQLILDGHIAARIDSHNKILYVKDVDQRRTTFEKAIQMGKEYQRRMKALILRAAVLKNKIHVKAPTREGSGEPMGSSSDRSATKL